MGKPSRVPPDHTVWELLSIFLVSQCSFQTTSISPSNLQDLLRQIIFCWPPGLSFVFNPILSLITLKIAHRTNTLGLLVVCFLMSLAPIKLSFCHFTSAAYPYPHTVIISKNFKYFQHSMITPARISKSPTSARPPVHRIVSPLTTLPPPHFLAKPG